MTEAMLADQVKQGNLARHVAGMVDRIAGEPQQFRVLTESEIFKILDHDCWDRAAWTLALYGLRRGEISGLRWVNVNLTDGAVDGLQARSVRIIENRVSVAGRVEVDTPKSKTSRRVLPLPDEVVEVLRATRKRQLEARLAFGPGFGSGEYVVADEAGVAYHTNTLTQRWGRMLDELSIPRVRLHDARHSSASLMHMRHVPIAVIASWLGHSSAAFTLTRYVHSQEDALRGAAGSFGRVVTSRDTEAR